MINAFMEGTHAAKKGKNIRINPYRGEFAVKDSYNEYRAKLWDEGFSFQCENE